MAYPTTSAGGCAPGTVAAEFSQAEVGALLSLVVTINAWNMLAVASRAWEPAAD